MPLKTDYNEVQIDRIIREPERKFLTGLSRVRAYELEQQGLFPRRRKLYEGGHAVGWLLSEISEWISSRSN